MDLNQLQLDDKVLRAMYTLRLQVEIAEHQHFHVTRSTEDLAVLLSSSGRSKHPLVKSAHGKFVRLLSREQLQLFESMGVSLFGEKPSDAVGILKN